MITITFPDGTAKEFKKGTNGMDIAKSIAEGLARNAFGILVNGIAKDISSPLYEHASVKILTAKDKEGIEILRHTSTHIMAQAVKRLFPYAKPTIGPVVEEGFYYDFDHEPFSPEDLIKIEEEMEKIVKANYQIERKEISKEEAKKLFADNPYKLELINEFSEKTVSIYTQGDFTDLCRGPHLPATGKVKAIKLMKVAGAYWRADNRNKQLQRIYGISFPEKKELTAYLELLEEAKKRDHRTLGKQLDLVMFHEFAPGAPFFLKNGAIIYNELISFVRKEYQKRGYQEVITPQLYNKKLWEQSGHWEHYKENMFVISVEGEEHSLKPMNCPSHCLIYNRDTKSYRDLPIRIADFCCLHRNELSGTLSGLTRVRKFSQDDAHIFCRMDQVEEEVLGVLDFIKYVWVEVFGFKVNYYLSTRPEKALGDKALWDKAETMLAEALKKADLTYQIKEGDGAFYGPKIDIDLEDALGRKWQCPTCQLDFNLPKRFECMYEGDDSKKHQAVMIHRAVLGSLERFMGLMIEHFSGKFPLWLSPVQVTLLTVTDRSVPYAQEVRQALVDAGFRVETDFRSESIPKKVREAQLAHIPLMITIGDKEMEQKTLAVRTLDGQIKFGMSQDELQQTMQALVASKARKTEF